jgi:hypothetical protein
MSEAKPAPAQRPSTTPLPPAAAAPRHHPRHLRSHPKRCPASAAQANLAVAATIDNQKAIRRALVRQAQANIEATTADLVCDRLEAQKCHKNRQNVRQLTDARRKASKISDHSAFVSSVYDKNLGGKRLSPGLRRRFMPSADRAAFLSPPYSGPLQRRSHCQGLGCPGAKRCNSTVQEEHRGLRKIAIAQRICARSVPGAMHVNAGPCRKSSGCHV